MRWTSTTVLAISLTLGLTACARSNEPLQRQDQVRSQNVTDNKLTDPRIVAEDKDLKQGDLGIGGGGSADRPFAAQAAIPQVFPNWSVKPINGSYAENAIATAQQFMGTPYLYGSDRDDPSSFDCSDFTRWAYLSGIGMDLPLDSRSQARYVQAYSNRSYYNLNNARRGDLLFFTSFNGVNPDQYQGVSKTVDSVSHCGIYLGNGKMIHTASPRTGGVRIDNVFGNHLQWRFFMGGTVLDQK
ncbi:cell wall-associated NlpC family hydrolase [Paenibacillus phyllosphaerae]|uniref:Cell wall-associated NlpC family hydrolase n=1 Tax=Paenibacillus phyllosphaerae TaxID=274593 RepID=A0A7W5FNZ9_9BACL|nr:C40 family peptidase [Paenibacillus phyllosphaerae]MBB3111851.1 cell wall-associated NlpC family hydrolase [Paenibacillus phyllosphaerae]